VTNHSDAATDDENLSKIESNKIAAPLVAKGRLGSHPRVGYSPYSPSLVPPGDRRRFVSYALARNVPFEIANPKEKYDLVVLSELSDISVWPDYPHGKMVYDLIDSYLSVPRTQIKQLLRGPAWYLAGRNERFQIDFLTGIRNICRRSDAVVCSATAQRPPIEQYCKNVHVILDFQSMVVGQVKSDYVAHAPFRLGWEGLPSNLTQLVQIAPVLRAMEGRDLSLHVVSDAFRVRLNGVLGKADSRDLLSRHLSRYEFHDWDEATCSDIMTSCDLAVIPIDLGDPLVRGKSVNKLLLLWRMGMPVVAAGTPAYREAMADVGTPELACASQAEWVAAIERMMGDEQLRRHAAARGRRYADTRYGTDAILSRWDAMFASIGFDFGGQSRAVPLKAAS
jgi:hypothetical protein